MATPNKHKAPKKQWAKWSDQARQVFNLVFSTMTRDQSLFIHPKGVENRRTHWRTTCWNAAWVAADAADGFATKAV